MPKTVHNDVLDYGLDVIKTRCTREGIVSTTVPSTVSSASTLCYAIKAMTTASYSITDGDISGRKITIAQQSTIPITTTGTAGHIILFSTGASGVIYYATSCTTQALVSTANSVTINAWDIEIADPT